MLQKSVCGCSGLPAPPGELDRFRSEKQLSRDEGSDFHMPAAIQRFFSLDSTMPDMLRMRFRKPLMSPDWSQRDQRRHHYRMFPRLYATNICNEYMQRMPPSSDPASVIILQAPMRMGTVELSLAPFHSPEYL
jgi:hypothetical protein